MLRPVLVDGHDRKVPRTIVVGVTVSVIDVLTLDGVLAVLLDHQAPSLVAQRLILELLWSTLVVAVLFTYR